MSREVQGHPSNSVLRKAVKLINYLFVCAADNNLIVYLSFNKNVFI